MPPTRSSALRESLCCSSSYLTAEHRPTRRSDTTSNRQCNPSEGCTQTSTDARDGVSSGSVDTPIPQRPLVSVCLPVYNGEAWVGKAVESALAQTYENLEIVVSDNASTDGTAAVVRSFDDPRVRLSTAAERVTMSGNHNRAVGLARGGLLKFLHADDSLVPECVAEMA